MMIPVRRYIHLVLLLVLAMGWMAIGVSEAEARTKPKAGTAARTKTKPNVAAAKARTRPTRASKPTTRNMVKGKGTAAKLGKAKSTGRQRKAMVSRKRGRGRARVRVRNTPMTALLLQREIKVADGVQYGEYRSNGSVPVDVHVLTMDRTATGNAIRIVKGEDRADGLERIADMARRYDSTSTHKLIGLVNANFWRAYRNTPIGACVVDGEVVEMLPYKKWTCGFFDVRNMLYIDTFALQGTMKWGSGTIAISSVNRRVDSGVVLYNAFAGSTVPYVNARDIESAYSEALKDTVFTSDDSTENALSQEMLRQEIMRAQREANVEYPTVKIRVRYLRSPSVNVPFMCQVLSVDTGAVEMPLRGAVIAIPRYLLANGWPNVHDTITLSFGTNVHSSVRFMNAVCGTPRLVRNGVAKPEHIIEGSTGRRFIQQNLARTAIGTNITGDKIYLVAIEPTQSEQRTMGASLQQEARIMELLGAHNAMNLDGGGSAGMCIRADHVFWDGLDPSTRRISVGLAIVKLSHVLRTQGTD